MKIRTWEEIITPGNYRKKKKKNKGEDDPQQEEPVPKASETENHEPDEIDMMYQKKTVQTDITTTPQDKKMGVEDFKFKNGKVDENRLRRVKALAGTYPFMFEKEFLRELDELEEQQKSKKEPEQQ